MAIKRVLILVILLVVAGYFYSTQTNGTLKPELSDFAVSDTASITKIILHDKNDVKVELNRLSKGTWQVNNEHFVREDAINNLLSTIHDVKVMKPVNKTAFENVVKNLSASSIEVRIYQDDEEPSKVYYVGGPNQAHTGTFMLIKGSSVPFETHIEGMYGYLTTRYFTAADRWRSTEVFAYNYGAIQTLQIEFPLDPESSFQITDLGNDQFEINSMQTGEVVPNTNQLAIKQYMALYEKIHFEGLEETKAPQYRAAVQATTPQEIYTVKGKDGRVTKLTTFLKPADDGMVDLEGQDIDFDVDRMYATLNDKDFVVIQHFVFDPINKKLDDFLTE